MGVRDPPGRERELRGPPSTPHPSPARTDKRVATVESRDTGVVLLRHFFEASGRRGGVTLSSTSEEGVGGRTKPVTGGSVGGCGFPTVPSSRVDLEGGGRGYLLRASRVSDVPPIPYPCLRDPTPSLFGSDGQEDRGLVSYEMDCSTVNVVQN